MQWNNEQRYWFPVCDRWGRTNFENIFAAGDGTGVSGAVAAEYRGELTALEIARCLGILPLYERDALAAPLPGIAPLPPLTVAIHVSVYVRWWNTCSG